MHSGLLSGVASRGAETLVRLLASLQSAKAQRDCLIWPAFSPREAVRLQDDSQLVRHRCPGFPRPEQSSKTLVWWEAASVRRYGRAIRGVGLALQPPSHPCAAAGEVVARQATRPPHGHLRLLDERQQVRHRHPTPAMEIFSCGDGSSSTARHPTQYHGRPHEGEKDEKACACEEWIRLERANTIDEITDVPLCFEIELREPESFHTEDTFMETTKHASHAGVEPARDLCSVRPHISSHHLRRLRGQVASVDRIRMSGSHLGAAKSSSWRIRCIQEDASGMLLLHLHWCRGLACDTGSLERSRSARHAWHTQRSLSRTSVYGGSRNQLPYPLTPQQPPWAIYSSLQYTPSRPDQFEWKSTSPSDCPEPHDGCCYTVILPAQLLPTLTIERRCNLISLRQSCRTATPPFGEMADPRVPWLPEEVP
ncbi:hypothetical protein P154DRAFT_536062 [Amniculicola lignicola CBS 123094]|uniref:Uncharacterized protein n=1 Tax=Amniculicola lignicola CBS 123094 TaxID=1392246 RepID=A0A6A5WAP3_9PLEO|nr:hypothetical protein P154DRAFT_536062 [Amniculicola lignicola CBS 123094]